MKNTSKKKNSLHGFFASQNNPVSTEQIVQWIKEDRAEDEESELEDAQRLSHAWVKYRKNNNLKGTFSEYLGWLRANC
jgi:hypothetical protein